MKTKKLRRHSGRIYPKLLKGTKKEEIIEEGLEPQTYWDDWKDYRDGIRGNNDRKMLRNVYMKTAKYFNVNHWNKKLMKLILRRKARK